MNIFGVLAQLTRALDLHSRGREFESHMLHKFGSVTRDGIGEHCKCFGSFHGEFESLTAHNIVKASRFL